MTNDFYARLERLITMHTYEYYEGKDPIFIHHNGDYSGKVIISAYAEEMPIESHTVPTVASASGFEGASPKIKTEVELPADLLINFVMEFLRANRIRELEQMSADELIEYFGA